MVEIKGYGGSLSLVLSPEASFEEIEAEVNELLQDASSRRFLQGADIVLRAGQREWLTEEFDKLHGLLEKSGLNLCRSRTDEISPKFTKKIETPEIPNSGDDFAETPETYSSPQIALPTLEEYALPEENEMEENSEDTELFPGLRTEDTLVIRQTLRSGQSVRSSRSVVVFGDLNSGAEIVSDGDIVVLGSIRGMVHAGASGNEKTCIVGLRITPTQIRIGRVISRPPAKMRSEGTIGPERVFVENGQVVIENQPCEPHELLKALSEAQHPETRHRHGSRGGKLISVGAIRW